MLFLEGIIIFITKELFWLKNEAPLLFSAPIFFGISSCFFIFDDHPIHRDSLTVFVTFSVNVVRMLELKLNVISVLTFELSKESSECILFFNLSGVDLLLFYKKSVH